MHARHRSPATVYNRSSSAGMSGAGRALPISSDGSMTSRGMYNSEYRNYKRSGYGRSQPRQFEQRLQKSDIFMEAGRMAAEYLVSKGMLPRSALSGKLQNGSLKNHIGYSQNFRTPDWDNVQLSMEGRTSALSRLGSAADGEGKVRKRYPNDSSSVASKDYIRRRKRHGWYKDSEWDPELGRSVTWSDRAKASPDIGGHANAFTGHQDEKQDVKHSDGELQHSPASESNLETDGIQNLVRDTNSTLNRSKPVEDTSAIIMGKDVQSSDEADLNEKSDCLEASNEIDNASDSNGTESKAVKDDMEIDLCADKDNQTNKNDIDLLSLCKFESVPRRTRSSLTARGPKAGAGTMAEENDSLESRHPKELEADGEDISMHISSVEISLHQNNDTEPLGSENSKILANEEVPNASENSKTETLGSENSKPFAFTIIEENSDRASSLAEHHFLKDDEENEGVHMFERGSSTGRGKKRSLDDIDNGERSKKPRELVLSDETETGVFVYSNSMENQQSLHEQSTTNDEPAMLSPEHKKFVDVSLFSSDVPTTEFSEKQLFPGSFKTCDLNYMETSDVNHNSNAHSVMMFPCSKENGKQTTLVDIGLSVNESYNLVNKYSKCRVGGRDIEVIDLENDSEQDKPFNNPQSSENGFTAHDGFSSDANDTKDIADAQDGYGPMLSDFLGNDIRNCSSVPEDMNHLHTDIGLHNGEGILGEDDSIYMSLGEIPISFSRAWQPPSQEFGKPF